MIQDIAAGAWSSTPQGFAVSESNLFFSADGNVGGRVLWVLPGFAASLPPEAFRANDHDSNRKDERSRNAHSISEQDERGEHPSSYRLLMGGTDIQ